jgi:protein TonB
VAAHAIVQVAATGGPALTRCQRVVLHIGPSECWPEAPVAAAMPGRLRIAPTVAAGSVAVLHLLLAWLLCGNPATPTTQEPARRPVEVRLLRPEVRLLPRPRSLRAAFSLPAAPPPPFVPPPEVQVPEQPEATVRASDLPQPLPAGAGRDAHAAGRGRAAASAATSTPPQIDFSRCGKPVYPDVNVQGTTLIVFAMDATGAISDAEVAEPSGPSRRHRILDRLAREFVLSCKGTPGTVNGLPVPLRGVTPIAWQLTN